MLKSFVGDAIALVGDPNARRVTAGIDRIVGAVYFFDAKTGELLKKVLGTDLVNEDWLLDDALVASDSEIPRLFVEGT